MLDVVDTLRQLVQIPSVNPMGRAVAGPQYFEEQLTNFLAGTFASLGIPFERYPVHPLRDNIIARIEGTPGAPTLMLEVHQDTVPVEGMTIDPFAAEIRDGCMWGRGACDVKGSLAVVLATASRILAEQPTPRPNIVIACTVNEEHGFTGATKLVELWQSGQSKLLPQPPDSVIVFEPTEMNVVVAHKGVVRWKCHAHGRATHSSNPAAGDNAIYRMARVIPLFEKYAKEEVASLAEHPLIGRPTLSVGTIAGGISVNTVPDRCTIEIDRRLIPGEDPANVYQRVVDYVTRGLGDEARQVTHDAPFIVARGMPDTKNGPLAERVIAAARAAGISSQRIGVPFGTDASAFALSGVPAVVFGPGSIAQAHTVDEFIQIDQLHSAMHVVWELVRS